jgi:DNA-binding IclR family transcriptional regulator
LGTVVSSSFVKSAERTLDVLHLLASRLRPVPASVVAQECGIPRSSTYHLLNVLHERGWVNHYEAEHAWGLGVTAFETGSAYLRSEPLQRAGRPLLAALTEHTGDTAHLAILEGTDVLYIDKEESRTAPRLVTEIGVRLPAHLTAVGRAILSRLSPAQVRALYARPVLVRRTGRGPRNVHELLGELAAVATRGYAVEEGTTTVGICCIAAPVIGHDGLPAASVGITFVAAQRQGDQRDDAAVKVVETANRLAGALGPRRLTG